MTFTSTCVQKLGFTRLPSRSLHTIITISKFQTYEQVHICTHLSTNMSHTYCISHSTGITISHTNLKPPWFSFAQFPHYWQYKILWYVTNWYWSLKILDWCFQTFAFFQGHKIFNNYVIWCNNLHGTENILYW